jgi:SAM-dependent methyltransferase
LTPDRGFASVQSFYDRHRFPDYATAKYRFPDDLYRYANPYTLLIDAHIPAGASVVDVGCGTGQLSCLLALKPRKVLGIDFSDASLAKAAELKQHLGLMNVEFRRVDVARVEPTDQVFDVVFCNGIFPCLPHGRDVFARICRAFGAPGSIVVLGLYHTWGRLLFRLRRRLGRFVPEIVDTTLQTMLMKQESDDGKLRSWRADQFEPPVEVCHRAVQIRSWFDEQAIVWIRSIPALPTSDRDRGLLVAPARRGSAWRWSMQETTWLWSLRGSGGYFVVIGRMTRP